MWVNHVFIYVFYVLGIPSGISKLAMFYLTPSLEVNPTLFDCKPPVILQIMLSPALGSDQSKATVLEAANLEVLYHIKTIKPYFRDISPHIALTWASKNTISRYLHLKWPLILEYVGYFGYPLVI
jgi:hypothetical protein